MAGSGTWPKRGFSCWTCDFFELLVIPNGPGGYFQPQLNIKEESDLKKDDKPSKGKVANEPEYTKGDDGLIYANINGVQNGPVGACRQKPPEVICCECYGCPIIERIIVSPNTYWCGSYQKTTREIPPFGP